MLGPWQQITTMNLGVATVFQVALGSTLLTKMVLLAALLGNLTAFNSFLIGASRVLFALGRARIIGTSLGVAHPRYGSPARAAVFVSVVASIGIFLGRGLILPIVNVTSSCFTLVFLLICAGVVKTRLRPASASPPPAYRVRIVTACLGCIGAAFMLVLSLYQPYEASGRGSFPPEWTILLIWMVLGAVFWFVERPIRSSVSEEERRQLILRKCDSISRPSIRSK